MTQPAPEAAGGSTRPATGRDLRQQALRAVPLPRTWRAQLVALQVLTLVGVLVLCLGGADFVVRRDAEQQTEREALAIARTLAADPRYAGWVETLRPSPTGPVQQTAEAARRRNGALFVVVADDQGIRYSYPDPAQVGRHVSTSEQVAMAGVDQTLVESGGLGLSARGKVPLRTADGRIVGVVSVGLPISAVHQLQRRLSLLLAALGALALAAGLAALVGLWRRLRRVTLGLQADDMADLLREHAALLDGSGDGVLAVDPQGMVRVCSGAASRHLGVDVPRGTPLATSGLPAHLAELLDPSRPAATGTSLVVAGQSVLELRVVPVEHEGRDLGRVLVLHDRTDLDGLGRELEATRALTDALRAQTHEHANRLHTLSGMLNLGHVDDARDYLAELGGPARASQAVADPYLAGLLAAKTAVAAELGVELRLDPESWLDGRVRHPLDCVTVVGNLVDNAVRAAAEGSRRPGWVELCLLGHDEDLLVHVADSGDGVAPEHVDRLFDDGWTTRTTGEGRHGVGLALARVTARRLGGEVRLADAGGRGQGAAFSAVLAGVLGPGAPGRAAPALEPSGPGSSRPWSAGQGTDDGGAGGQE